MHAPANASPHAPWWRDPRVILSVVLAVPLWISLCRFPVAPDTFLDASWEEVLIYGHARGWQYGKDIVYTSGPWSFLNSLFHFGAVAATPRLVWEVLGKLLLASALVALTHRVHVWRQIAFVVACTFFNHFFVDIVFLVFLTLAVVRGLMPRDARPRRLCAWLLALTFLAEFKFTYMLLTFAGVVAATWVWAARGDRRTAFGLIGGYFAAYLAFWMAAGQSPGNLATFLFRSLEITRGYDQAMALDETVEVFRCAVAALALYALFIWRLWRTIPERVLGWMTAGFMAGTLFVVWKHGFTRADGHVYSFFIYVLLMTLVLPGFYFPGKLWHWLDLTPLICLLAIWYVNPIDLTLSRPIAFDRIRRNANDLMAVAHLRDDWESAAQASRTTAALPAVKRAVGDGTVDVYNYHQGAALLNDLSFTPRPIFQSYCAFTSHLAELNLAFYRSERAPDFLLCNYASIDERFPTLDDAPLIPELARAYEPELVEGDYLLLKRTAALPATRLDRELIAERTLSFGESFEIPPVRDAALWLQAKLPLSLLGRLRAFVYKPPIMRMVVTDDTGRKATWRMLPRIAEDGFLLSPLLETQFDFAAFLRGRGRKWVGSLQFESPGQRHLWGKIEVRLFALRELALQADPPFQALADAGIADRAPDSLVMQTPLEMFALGAGRAMLLHAPAEITFSVPEGAERFSGTFGLRDQAYELEDRTNGVEFVVDGVWPDGRTETLWRRFLDPIKQEGDRGSQSFVVELPRDRPAQVVLRTLPGPGDDASWDWSFCTDLRFAPTDTK